MAKWVGKLWVTGTTLLICFIAYSSQIFIIWPWYGAELSVELLYLLLPFKYFAWCRMSPTRLNDPAALL
jgi:palmitoyltransferase ZDHHC6